MHDREWVIEGLEFTLQEAGWDANAAYDQGLMIQVVTEAIALLKAQEPVEPVRRRRHGQIGYSCFCGMCGYGIGRNEKYCALCGRPVKWG